MRVKGIIRVSKVLILTITLTFGLVGLTGCSAEGPIHLYDGHDDTYRVQPVEMV